MSAGTGAPPRRGSAAADQRRDRRGRFVAADGPLDRPCSRALPGRTGPTYLARKSKLELVRIATRLTLRLSSLQAEAIGQRPVHPLPAIPKRALAMVQMRKEETARRRDLLSEIMVNLAESRTEVSPTILAREMTILLGKHFGVEQLFRSGLIGVWNPDADFFGREEEDQLACAKQLNRLNRRALMAKLQSTESKVRALEHSRKLELVKESADQNWSLSEILPLFDETVA